MVDKMIDKDVEWIESRYTKIVAIFKDHKKSISNRNRNAELYHLEIDREFDEIGFEMKVIPVTSNMIEVTNYLVYYAYQVDSSAKPLVWDTLGKYIFETLSKNSNNTFLYPVVDKNGDYEYLGDNYTIKEMKIDGQIQV